MARVVVTGGTGFVGRVVLAQLSAARHDVISLERAPTSDSHEPRIQRIVPGESWAAPALAEAFRGADTVIHLASRNHHVGDDSAETSHLYKRDILELTEAVAEACATVGVPRLVHLSTIKARKHEVCTTAQEAATAAEADPYGAYKLAAERQLAEIYSNARTPGQCVILRPPLVYAIDARGNFGTMINLVRRRIPIPMPSGLATRALLSRENLVSALLSLVADDASNSGTATEKNGTHVFEICDATHYTLVDQFRGIGRALNKSAMIVPTPNIVVESLLKATKRSALLRMAREELLLSNDDLTAFNGWTPEFSWLSDTAHG